MLDHNPNKCQYYLFLSFKPVENTAFHDWHLENLLLGISLCMEAGMLDVQLFAH